MSLEVKSKPDSHRDYPMCKCGRPATRFTPNGEGFCKQCHAIRKAMMPMKRRRK